MESTLFPTRDEEEDELLRHYVDGEHDPIISTNRLRLRFDNEFGVSIVQGPYTYGGKDGLFELAVVTFGEGNDHHLHYDNPVARGDVRGHLTAEETRELAFEVKSFSKRSQFKWRINKIIQKTWCKVRGKYYNQYDY